MCLCACVCGCKCVNTYRMCVCMLVERVCLHVNGQLNERCEKIHYWACVCGAQTDEDDVPAAWQ